MPLGKTPILQNDLMAEGDNNKYLLFNDALVALEDAANRLLTINMSAGNRTLLDSEALRYAFFKCTGHTVARTLTLPILVGGGTDPFERKIAVRNAGTAALTVTCNNGGQNLVIPAGNTALIYSDGTDVISMGGVANAGVIPLSEDGVEIIAQLMGLNFAGAGFTITHSAGAATITFDIPEAVTDLTGVPTFTGNGGKIVRVRVDATGFEYIDLPETETPLTVKTKYESNPNTNAFTDAEKSKLAAIEAGATADMTPAEIKSAYEANANTNAFTDAEKAKLAGLDAPAYKGTYLTLAALQSAHPVADPGSYAFVDAGIGSDALQYIWDDDDSEWIAGGSGGGSSETAASIKTKYESNADTNAFTDAEKSKLAAIEAGATADMTPAEIVAAVDAALGGTGWQGAGGGAGGIYAAEWKGTRAYFTISSGATSTWLQIPFSASQFDNISAYGIAGLTIPAGVTKARLRAMVRRNAYSGNNQFTFYKNGVSLTEGSGGAVEGIDSGYTNNGSTMQTGVLDVVAGDVFDLRVFASNTPNFVGWVELEVVAGDILGSVTYELPSWERVVPEGVAGQRLGYASWTHLSSAGWSDYSNGLLVENGFVSEFQCWRIVKDASTGQAIIVTTDGVDSGTDFDHVFTLRASIPGTSDEGFGLFIGNGTERTSFEIRQNFTAVMRSWTAGLVFEALEGTYTSTLANSAALRTAERIYMRLKRVSSDVTFSFSVNGILWTDVFTVSLPVSGLTDVTEVGVFIDSDTMESRAVVDLVGHDITGPQSEQRSGYDVARDVITMEHTPVSVPNLGFEAGDLTGWTIASGAPVVEARVGGFGSWSTRGHGSGTYSLVGGASSSSVYRDIPVSGTAFRYALEATLAQYDLSNSDSVTVTFAQIDSADVVLDSVSASRNTNGTNRARLFMLAHPAATRIRVTIDFVKDNPGSYVWALADDIYISETEFVGSNGDVTAAPLTLRQFPLNVPNGDFSGGSTHWTTLTGTTEVTPDSAHATIGAHPLGYSYIGKAFSATGTWSVVTEVPLSLDEHLFGIYASFDHSCSHVNDVLFLYVTFKDSHGNVIPGFGGQVSIQGTVAGAWNTVYTSNIPVPASAVAAVLRFVDTAPSSTDGNNFFTNVRLYGYRAYGIAVPNPLQRSTMSDSYVLSNLDFEGNKIIKITNGLARTVTVPVGLEPNEPVMIVRGGAGALSIAPAPGVTIFSADGMLGVRSQFSAVTLIPDGVNQYLLVGDLV